MNERLKSVSSSWLTGFGNLVVPQFCTFVSVRSGTPSSPTHK